MRPTARLRNRSVCGPTTYLIGERSSGRVHRDCALTALVAAIRSCGESVGGSSPLIVIASTEPSFDFIPSTTSPSTSRGRARSISLCGCWILVVGCETGWQGNESHYPDARERGAEATYMVDHAATWIVFDSAVSAERDLDISSENRDKGIPYDPAPWKALPECKE